MIVSQASWQDLEAEINEIKQRYAQYDDRWRIIENHPLTTRGIDQLQRD